MCANVINGCGVDVRQLEFAGRGEQKERPMKSRAEI
jgi:hypothetical protein